MTVSGSAWNGSRRTAGGLLTPARARLGDLGYYLEKPSNLWEISWLKGSS
jgi:hypothetical protein